MEINQERFEAWLFSQPADRVIEAGNTCKCFICSFLKETTNVAAPWVLWERWAADYEADYNDTKSLPKWARKLIDNGWLMEVSESRENYAITCGQMQARYRELFPEKENHVESHPVRQTASV
jgi:hypothetical protein